MCCYCNHIYNYTTIFVVGRPHEDVWRVMYGGWAQEEGIFTSIIGTLAWRTHYMNTKRTCCDVSTERTGPMERCWSLSSGDTRAPLYICLQLSSSKVSSCVVCIIRFVAPAMWTIVPHSKIHFHVRLDMHSKLHMPCLSLLEKKSETTTTTTRKTIIKLIECGHSIVNEWIIKYL